MSESIKTPEPQGSVNEESSMQPEKKTPNKRGRMSFIERAQKESEELVKNMGGSLELEGGRRTRSSARGTPSRAAVVTPPPVKKARNSPASPKSTPRARGRGRKLDTTETPEPPEQQQSKEKEEKVERKTPISVENEATEEVPAEKPETNGPEKSTDEHDNDAEPEKSTNVETKLENLEKVEQAANDNKVVDQVDATLKSVQEDQGKLSESVKPEKPKDDVQEKTVASTIDPVDSPMEVEEQPSTQEVAVVQHVDSKSETGGIVEVETKAIPTTVESEPASSVETVSEPAPSVETVSEPVTVEKQPTPEPMEIDSSSKSSDVIECTDVVDKEDSAVSSAQDESLSFVEETTGKPVPNILVNDSLPVAEKAIDTLTPSQANSEENGTTGEVDISVPVVAEIKTIEAPADKEESKIESVIESKTENNIDEPKVTPQLSAAGDAVVTSI